MSEVYPHPTSATAPLRSRSEASLATTLCLLFKLAPSEGQMLAKLVTHDHCTKDELCTIAGHNNQVLAFKSVTVIVYALRVKLKPYGIKVTTLYRRGYGLDKAARSKLHKLLTEHDEAIMSTQALRGGG